MSTKKKILKLKDIDPNKSLKDIKLKMPLEIYKNSSLPMYGIKNVGIYIVGPGMGDFFVKINRNSTRIYPLFNSFISYDKLKEWEVLKVYN